MAKMSELHLYASRIIEVINGGLAAVQKCELNLLQGAGSSGCQGERHLSLT